MHLFNLQYTLKEEFELYVEPVELVPFLNLFPHDKKIDLTVFFAEKKNDEVIYKEDLAIKSPTIGKMIALIKNEPDQFIIEFDFILDDCFIHIHDENFITIRSQKEYFLDAVLAGLGFTNNIVKQIKMNMGFYILVEGKNEISAIFNTFNEFLESGYKT